MFRFFNGNVSFCRMLRIAEFSVLPSLVRDGGRASGGSQSGNPVSRAEAPLGRRWFGLNWREETFPQTMETQETIETQEPQETPRSAGDGDMPTLGQVSLRWGAAAG